MKLRTALLSATVLAAPFVVPMAAKAQPISGLYVGAGAGVNYRQQQDISKESINGVATTGLSGGTLNRHSDIGAVGLGSVGWGLGNGLRFEIEGSYRQNKATKTNGVSPGLTYRNGSDPTGGNIETYAAMANAAYDFNLGLPIFPYVGVGVGYAWTDMKGVKEQYGVSGTRGAYSLNLDSTEGNLAYQAFLGAAFPIDAVPGLSVTAEYRFFGTLGNTYSGNAVTYNGAKQVSYALSQKFGEAYNHSGLIGLRYAFGAAPVQAPVIVPVRQVATNYLVFFDWDRADLTARARQIIAQAAEASRSRQTTNIEVDGYTDTSGTPRYNQGLSVRRAQSVASELVRDGVPRGAITIQGFGETNLLVPTGPGVREPQNRRVVIILH
jgi:outer membrane protein OmpA-like peptidoglycan-associated protein